MRTEPLPGARVVVGMSGGVDSSVAAALLVDRGFDVVGVTIKTYDYDDVGGNDAGESSCCSLDGITDARLVCDQLGIPHYVLDFSARFREQIIDPFIDEYVAGRTPNPCVRCNRSIKWGHLLEKATALGATHVAMGHYARLGHDAATGRVWVSRGRDRSKDQSYALWAVAQEDLARTIFPLADMTKDDARAYAVARGIRTAGKHESYEICFVHDNDYTRFLRDRVDGLDARVRGGEVQFEGRVVGRHDGYPFYTIGQRRGLNVAVGEPVYVTEIRAGDNVIVVGREPDLLHTRCLVREVAMQKHPLPTAPLAVHARIRYKDEGAPAMLHPRDDGTIELVFDAPRRAITPGQSTVWYEGDDVVGGGVIDQILE